MWSLAATGSNHISLLIQPKGRFVLLPGLNLGTPFKALAFQVLGKAREALPQNAVAIGGHTLLLHIGGHWHSDGSKDKGIIKQGKHSHCTRGSRH